MDKLKDNVFAISVGGVGILLLLLFYFLVWSPLQLLASQEKVLKVTVASMKRIDKLEETPSSELVDFYHRRKDEEQQDLDQALEFCESRLGLFQRYFGGARTPPDVSSFFSTYEDGVNTLITKYREKFGITVSSEDVTTNVAPKVNNRVKSDPNQEVNRQNIPLAMKEYRIIESIFEACMELGLGGIQEISLPLGEARRERGRRSKPGEVKSQFLTSSIEATLKIELRFGDIEDLITKLFEDPDVSFVDVPAFTYVKTEESFAKYRAVLLEAGEAGDKKYEETVPEPTVHATLTLRALSWGGLRPVEEPADR